ncbi:hypothetical protein [Jannaschia aquimarina]|uniref:DUF4365 domain-containing protein n=1 Tax=Jannaschia aquimarina TaxID=935700 RepID=A0A0D1EFB8_9RHOB|nr:hypothetical protein [Jannaschia aquimarina]KIT15586.1 hypothetical protein jaqu_26830 [Jannaschia aquimarina]SNT27310.1 hypothetical protein SAMN05421775_109137 [Jannaschia aquimarina]
MSKQGQHGENLFATRCTAPGVQAQAVVNPSLNDEHGWDHVVEIELPQEVTRPADLRTPILTCYAQIKTTRGTRPKRTVKLSNALKAVRSPAPSFVFLLHYRPSGEIDFYGRHIWTDEIERTLKRAREAGESDLHRLTLALTFNDDDRLESPPPDWMIQQLPTTDGLAYTDAKRSLVQSVGYDGNPWVGTVTIGPMESMDDIVLHEIGVIEDLPFSTLRVMDCRFGIEVEDPSMSMEGGRISMMREGRPLTVRMTSQDGETFSVPALAWAPISVAPGSPDFKVRAKAGPIDLVFGGVGKEPFSLRVDWAGRYTLLELFALFATRLWSSPGPMRIDLEAYEGELMSGSLTIHEELENWFSQAWQCARFVLDILGRERCAATSMTIAQFGEAMKSVHAVAAIQTSGSIRIEAVFPDDLPEFDTLAFYSCAQIGEWAVGTIHEMPVRAKADDGDRTTFYFSQPSVIDQQVYKRSIEVARTAVSDAFAAYRKGAERVAHVGDGDLPSWIAHRSEDSDIMITVGD